MSLSSHCTCLVTALEAPIPIDIELVRWQARLVEFVEALEAPKRIGTLLSRQAMSR